MRIVAGKWRGRAVEAPEGRGTRPTTDRTREAIASMVLSAEGLDLAGKSVLDAFAGSGAMGFELLSRGAAHATLVDKDRRAVACMRRTAAALKASAGELSVVCADALACAAGAGAALPGAPFHIVFLDPPYALLAEQVESLVAALASAGRLAPGALVAYEHAADAPGLALSALHALKSKRRGVSAVDLYRYEDGAPTPAADERPLEP